MLKKKGTVHNGQQRYDLFSKNEKIPERKENNPTKEKIMCTFDMPSTNSHTQYVNAVLTAYGIVAAATKDITNDTESQEKGGNRSESLKEPAQSQFAIVRPSGRFRLRREQPEMQF